MSIAYANIYNLTNGLQVMAKPWNHIQCLAFGFLFSILQKANTRLVSVFIMMFVLSYQFLSGASNDPNKASQIQNALWLSFSRTLWVLSVCLYINSREITKKGDFFSFRPTLSMMGVLKKLIPVACLIQVAII